jgi:hypothetical protein
MPPVGFETTISADDRPQTYASDCAATGTGRKQLWKHEINRVYTSNDWNDSVGDVVTDRRVLNAYGAVLSTDFSIYCATL